MPPKTHYARSGDVNIAYQVLGAGPRDLVMVFGFVSNIEVIWEEPMLARFLTRLAGCARLIVFDKRGTGLSDRDTDMLSPEVRMDDVRAVMDAVGSERGSLVRGVRGRADVHAVRGDLSATLHGGGHGRLLCAESLGGRPPLGPI
jgi:pimeloyl-ACP methyl ester carboxylesterase